MGEEKRTELSQSTPCCWALPVLDHGAWPGLLGSWWGWKSLLSFSCISCFPFSSLSFFLGTSSLFCLSSSWIFFGHCGSSSGCPRGLSWILLGDKGGLQPLQPKPPKLWGHLQDQVSSLGLFCCPNFILGSYQELLSISLHWK